MTQNYFYIHLGNNLEELLEYASLLEACIPENILRDCQEFLQSIRSLLSQVEKNREGRVRASKMGRPALVIEEEKLSFFVDNGFRVEDIAIMFGCSKRTIERRLSEYQLSTRNYSTISDVQLDDLIGQTSSVFPRCGEKMMYGRLRMQGIHVQRERIRESLRRVDPSGVHSRMRRVR